MSKHSKYVRDLEAQDKPTLLKRRNELVKEFIDKHTDSSRADDLIDQLDDVEKQLKAR